MGEDERLAMELAQKEELLLSLKEAKEKEEEYVRKLAEVQSRWVEDSLYPLCFV